MSIGWFWCMLENGHPVQSVPDCSPVKCSGSCNFMSLQNFHMLSSAMLLGFIRPNSTFYKHDKIILSISPIATLTISSPLKLKFRHPNTALIAPKAPFVPIMAVPLSLINWGLISVQRRSHFNLISHPMNRRRGRHVLSCQPLTPTHNKAVFQNFHGAL